MSMYDLPIWRKLRASHLASNPLCVACKAMGRFVKADTVDHIKPHEGDWDLFVDPNNLQSLCALCHSRHKRRADNRGGVKASAE